MGSWEDGSQRSAEPPPTQAPLDTPSSAAAASELRLPPVVRTRPPEPDGQGPVSGREAKARPEAQRRLRRGHGHCSHARGQKPARPRQPPGREPPPPPAGPPPHLRWRPRAPSSSPRVAGPAASRSSRTSPPLSCARLGAAKGKGGRSALGAKQGVERGGTRAGPKEDDSSLPFSRVTEAAETGSPESLSPTRPRVALNAGLPPGRALGPRGRNRPGFWSRRSHRLPRSDHSETDTEAYGESRPDRLAQNAEATAGEKATCHSGGVACPSRISSLTSEDAESRGLGSCQHNRQAPGLTSLPLGPSPPVCQLHGSPWASLRRKSCPIQDARGVPPSSPLPSGKGPRRLQDTPECAHLWLEAASGSRLSG